MSDESDSQSPGKDTAANSTGRRLNLRIGNYLLGELLGEGGMGAVYIAEQLNPRRIVALKALRRGILSDGARANFLREAAHLGKLHHPNIAQIFEAGTHVEGAISVPYYSMELVPDARTIIVYAQQLKLNLIERLQLFRKVCNAAQYAHEQRILHCDLKPENILVDSTGTVKIIDFGIARAADVEQPGKTIQSATGIFGGTPQYMSPEQFTAREGIVTERSDVYSLGVVLYELLCGTLPYVVDRDDAIRAILTVTESDPIKPRAANPALPRDFERVILRCLRKDSRERYESVAAFRDDVDRLITGDRPTGDSASVTNSVLLVQRVIARHPGRAAVFMLSLLWTACASVLPALDAWKLGPAFQSLAVTHFHHFDDAPLSDVRIISIHPVNVPQLAKALGVEGLDFGVPKVMRALHGALMSKLAKAHCGIRALVWDIQFPGATDFDGGFAQGVADLRAIGTPVIAGTPWIAQNGIVSKSPSPLIARSGVYFGGMSANLAGNSPWLFDLTWRRGQDATRPSLALLAASTQWIGAPDTIAIEMDTDGIVVRAESSSPLKSGAGKRVVVSGFSKATIREAATETRIKPGDAMSHYAVEIPGDASLRATTYDYARVAAASDSDLRDWFDGKIVLIGDARQGADGPIKYPDGRMLSGHVGQAVAIQRLLSEQPILCVEHVPLFGARITLSAIMTISAAMAGLILGFHLASRVLWRIVTEAIVVGAMFGGSLLAYSFSARLLSPAIPICVFVVTCECLSLIESVGVKNSRRKLR